MQETSLWKILCLKYFERSAVKGKASIMNYLSPEEFDKIQLNSKDLEEIMRISIEFSNGKNDWKWLAAIFHKKHHEFLWKMEQQEWCFQAGERKKNRGGRTYEGWGFQLWEDGAKCVGLFGKVSVLQFA